MWLDYVSKLSSFTTTRVSSRWRVEASNCCHSEHLPCVVLAVSYFVFCEEVVGCVWGCSVVFPPVWLPSHPHCPIEGPPPPSRAWCLERSCGGSLVNQLKQSSLTLGPAGTSVLVEFWSCGGGEQIQANSRGSWWDAGGQLPAPPGYCVSSTPQGPALSLSFDSEARAYIVNAFLCCLF